MPACDVCREQKDETFSIPGTSSVICDVCLRSGRISELFGTSEPSEPAKVPKGPENPA